MYKIKSRKKSIYLYEKKNIKEKAGWLKTSSETQKCDKYIDMLNLWLYYQVICQP